MSVDPQTPQAPQADVVSGQSKEPFVGAYHDAANYVGQRQNTGIPTATDPPRSGKLEHWKKSDGTDLLYADDDGIRTSFFIGGMTGEMKLWAPSNLPEGWLWCDGATYTVAAQPALYAAIGTKFGGTVGVNFKVPDMRGRLPLGADPTGVQGVVYVVGSYYGNPSSLVNLQHQHGQASHVHGMANHTHDFAHTHDLLHSHPMGHDHTVTNHQHSYSFGTHGHTVNDHNHTFSFGTHHHPITHDHGLNSHTHSMQSHTHGHSHTVNVHNHTFAHGHSVSATTSASTNAVNGIQAGTGSTTNVRPTDHTHPVTVNQSDVGVGTPTSDATPGTNNGGSDTAGPSSASTGTPSTANTGGSNSADSGEGGATSSNTGGATPGTSLDGAVSSNTGAGGGQTTSGSSAVNTSNNGTVTTTDAAGASGHTTLGANGNTGVASPALTDPAGSTALNIQPPSAAIGYIIKN